MIIIIYYYICDVNLVINIIYSFLSSELRQGKKLSDVAAAYMDFILSPDITSTQGMGCDNMTLILIVFDHEKRKKNLLLQLQITKKELEEAARINLEMIQKLEGTVQKDTQKQEAQGQDSEKAQEEKVEVELTGEPPQKQSEEVTRGEKGLNLSDSAKPKGKDLSRFSKSEESTREKRSNLSAKPKGKIGLSDSAIGPREVPIMGKELTVSRRAKRIKKSEEEEEEQQQENAEKDQETTAQEEEDV